MRAPLFFLQPFFECNLSLRLLIDHPLLLNQSVNSDSLALKINCSHKKQPRTMPGKRGNHRRGGLWRNGWMKFSNTPNPRINNLMTPNFTLRRERPVHGHEICVSCASRLLIFF